MQIKFTSDRLSGDVYVPSSKSLTHRYLIAAALSGGCTVRNVSFSEDIYATIRCLKALGLNCSTDEQNGTVCVEKGEKPCGEALFDCGESGSTLRFFLPIALQLCEQGAKFIGAGRLLARPQQPYYDIFDQKGIAYAADEQKITVSGKMESGVYYLSGAVSSQFVTGLLFALSLCEGGESRIVITDELQSRAYVDMTVAAMQAFGVNVINHEYKEFVIPGGQQYQAADVSVEADYSQAAFFLTAAYFGHTVHVKGLNADSLQGDKAIVSILEQMKKPGEVTVDIGEIPDLAPIIAVAASVRSGVTHIVNGLRLRYKESDRIVSTVTELKKLGADIKELPDGMEIVGKEKLGIGDVVTCDSWNDHRIAMAVAIAALQCSDPVTLNGAEAVSKSYPHFWETYRSLGGMVKECKQ